MLSAILEAGSAAPALAAPELTQHYAAIGASDAVGIGASVPCGNFYSIFPGCPGGTGYVPDLSRADAGALAPEYLVDLGLTGAVIGPDIQALVNRYGFEYSDACGPRKGGDRVSYNFIGDELPRFPQGTNQVTIFAGGSDILGLVNAVGCGAAGTSYASQARFITYWVSAFSADLDTVVSTVRSRAPKAKIGIANVPDFADLPLARSLSAKQKALLTVFSVGFDTAINQWYLDPSRKIAIVDLLCNPQSYVAANYSPDGFHPNDRGYVVMAELFYRQLAAIGNKRFPPEIPRPTTCWRTLPAGMTNTLTSRVPGYAELLPNLDRQR